MDRMIFISHYRCISAKNWSFQPIARWILGSMISNIDMNLQDPRCTMYAKFCCSNSFGLGSVHRQRNKHTEILCIIAKMWTCTEFGVNWKCPYFLCLNSTRTTAWELHCVSPACCCS